MTRSFLRLATFVSLALLLIALPPYTARSQVALTIVHKTDLKFGEYAANPNATGTVVMPPDADAPTTTGGLIPFGGTIKRGKFQLVGEPKAFVIVSLPSSITIRKGTSSNFMTIDNFTINLPNPIKLSNKGKKTIFIGGTLHVGANQKQGNYNDENTFTIFADYL